MENKFKLKKPFPPSWGVYNDGSDEFAEWVVGYMNTLQEESFSGVFKEFVYGRLKNHRVGYTTFSSDFSTILTLEEFKSYFEVENEWREASKEYLGYVKFKMMELSDDKKDIIKLFVLYEMDGLFYGNYPIYRISDGNLNTYKYARELAEQALADNKQLFNEYFGIDE